LQRPWTRSSIQQVLTNEKYIGNNVYNRSSFKLKQKRVKNPPEMWIRSNGAFEAIVDAQLFYQAQGIMLERQRRFSDEEMLDRLRHLYRKHGKLSGFLIDETEGMPSSALSIDPGFGGWSGPIGWWGTHPIAITSISESTGFCGECTRTLLRMSSTRSRHLAVTSKKMSEPTYSP
jgi:hypothetical protein